tara:strand:+ start:403 stop:645 length:243 start_codon:yes stop_codon:yes gene_type:complete
MTEHEIIEKSFIIADKIYFTFIDELSKHEQEKFIIPDKDNIDNKGNIVGTKNTDLGIEIFDNIENTIIELLEQQASEQKG